MLELTFTEQCAYQDIAEIAGCPVNTIKTRMFHARKKLAELLAKRGYSLKDFRRDSLMTSPKNLLEHASIVELLPWYANGTLSPAEYARVDQYLTTCTECQ